MAKKFNKKKKQSLFVVICLFLMLFCEASFADDVQMKNKTLTVPNWTKKEADKGTDLRSVSLFELKDEYRDKIHFYDLDETVDMLLYEKMSLARFGNDEFGLIEGKDSRFQKFSPRIQKRLREVLSSSDPKIGIGIPLLLYTKDNREYWEKRAPRWQKLISNKRTYFPAEMSTRDIQSEYFFNRMREVWDDRNVLLIHGKGILDDIKYDIFDNAKQVKHQIAPNKHAFEKYDAILEEALKADKDDLIIIILGATATVLAYDLSKHGYQALDLGHIAKNYDWYKKGIYTERNNDTYFYDPD